MLPLFKTGDYMVLKKVLRKVAVLASMGVIVYASYEITKSYLEYSSGNSTYKSIDEMFIVSSDEEETETESKPGGLGRSSRIGDKDGRRDKRHNN